MEELNDIFSRPKIRKHFTTEQILEFFELLDESSEMVHVYTNTTICRDQKDNYLLSLAIDSKAVFLITGDKDLLVLDKIGNTRIINFKDFKKHVS